MHVAPRSLHLTRRSLSKASAPPGTNLAAHLLRRQRALLLQLPHAAKKLLQRQRGLSAQRLPLPRLQAFECGGARIACWVKYPGLKAACPSELCHNQGSESQFSQHAESHPAPAGPAKHDPHTPRSRTQPPCIHTSSTPAASMREERYLRNCRHAQMHLGGQVGFLGQIQV